MCKYSYLSGACANRRVESLHCVGEEECEFSGMNILGAVGAKRTTYDGVAGKWLGLYCRTHGRYLCSDGDDCNCHDGRSPKRTGSFQSKFGDEMEAW